MLLVVMADSNLIKNIFLLSGPCKVTFYIDFTLIFIFTTKPIFIVQHMGSFKNVSIIFYLFLYLKLKVEQVQMGGGGT